MRERVLTSCHPAFPIMAFTYRLKPIRQVKSRLMQGLKGSYGKVAKTAAGSFVVERCYNWAVSQPVWGEGYI